MCICLWWYYSFSSNGFKLVIMLYYAGLIRLYVCESMMRLISHLFLRDVFRVQIDWHGYNQSTRNRIDSCFDVYNITLRFSLSNYTSVSCILKLVWWIKPLWLYFFATGRYWVNLSVFDENDETFGGWTNSLSNLFMKNRHIMLSSSIPYSRHVARDMEIE